MWTELSLPGDCFNIKTLSYQHMNFHCRDKTISRSSYLYNGISYTGKTIYLCWLRAQKSNRKMTFVCLGRGCTCRSRCQDAVKAFTEYSSQRCKFFNDRIFIMPQSGRTVNFLRIKHISCPHVRYAWFWTVIVSRSYIQVHFDLESNIAIESTAQRFRCFSKFYSYSLWGIIKSCIESGSGNI